MAKIRLEKISYTYHKEPALKEISLKLPSSGFYGIVGPNGAGKSTLLKIITRFLVPAAGSVYLNGRELSSYSLQELAQEIALIPQTSHYFPFTVREVVGFARAPFNSRFQKLSKEDLQIIEKCMAAADVTHLADRLISDLSGGERQRTTIARAFAQDTAVLLLDEPTTHLDLEHQLRTCELLKARSQEGILCVAVLHDLNLVANYCDYVFVLKEGGLVAEGSPAEVLTPPLIEEIYNVKVKTLTHPETGKPVIAL